MSKIRNTTIDVFKTYEFSKGIVTIPFENQYVAINSNAAKWLVLSSEEFKFFELLREHSIKEAISIYNKPEIAKLVIANIEGRHFFEDEECKKVSCGAFSLHFYITSGCNMRCPHCFISAGDVLRDDLSFEEIQQTLKSFKSIGGEKVTLTGGEVAMRKDLEDIIRSAKDVSLKVEILTNGVLWTDEKIQRLSPYIDSVQISIDGYDEESNAPIRGKGNFDRALKALTSFAQNGVYSAVAITPPYSIIDGEHIKDYVIFAQKLKKKFEQFPDKLNIRFTLDLLDGREITLSQRERDLYHFAILKIYSAYYGTDATDMPFILQRRANQLLDNCSFGNLAIKANGDIFLCSRTDDCVSIGNVRSIDFEEVREQCLMAKKFSNIDNLTPCKQCPLKYICGGGCKIDFFPEIVSTSNFKDVVNKEFQRTGCNEKERMLRLMIKTSKFMNQ